MSARLFALLLAVTLGFRFWLAAVTPITGDEAYFIWWGWRPDWGFYDHPPMIGWWLAALLHWGDGELWLRLPAVLLPAFLSLAVTWALPMLAPRLGAAERYGIAALILLAPVNVWNVFITTDTPLVFFSVLSGLAWLRASRDDDLRWYFVSGLLLAGAVLSKYFAALLGFAYLVDVLLRRRPRAYVGLVLCYALTIPALALMAWWNAGHCWPNYMFNFVNRNEDAGFSWRTPLLYAVTLLYVLTPPVAWFALRRRQVAAMSFRRLTSAEFSAYPTLGVLAWVPFALFAALSLIKQIGLHWLLSFVPFALLWTALRLTPEMLRKLLRFFFAFALLHVAAIAVVSRLPLETWQKYGFYDGLVLTVEHQALLREIEPYRRQGWVLAMDGYSNAVTLGYDARQYFIVFGLASSHARHDDILTDFRAFDGRNILVLRKSEPAPAEYAPYFRQVAIDSFTVRGARFWRVKGEGFLYPAYRDGILAQARRKYYALPAWLPQTACYFCDRYFPGEACRR